MKKQDNSRLDIKVHGDIIMLLQHLDITISRLSKSEELTKEDLDGMYTLMDLGKVNYYKLLEKGRLK